MEQTCLDHSFSETPDNLRKCGILGCGHVGATTAYTLMQTGWFSELILLDLDTKKAEGEAADLRHGLPFHTPMRIYAGGYSDLADCGVIILTAGVGQRTGESRLDQARVNARIIRSIVNNIAIYNQTAILLVVSDPVDLLSYVAFRASGYPAARVIGSGTVLDTARLKQLLGHHLGVDSRNVHSFLIGEHGDNELAVWSSANISGVNLACFCESSSKGYDPMQLDRLFHQVKESAYRIAEAKGAGCYGVAESIKRIVSAIVHDESTILPVSALVSGHYGLEDVYMSLPCVVGRGGIRQVLEIPLDDGEGIRLRQSAKSLRLALKALDPLGHELRD